MIDQGVRSEIERLGDSRERHALVVEWTVRPDLSGAEQLATKRERLAFVDRLYDSIKRPWLDRWRSMEGVEVEDLRGTSQAIVTAPASRWRDLLAAGGTLDADGSIRVLPNRLYYALESP